MERVFTAFVVAFVTLISLPVAWAEPTEDIIFYHNDVLGNPVAATDESGDVIWQESYTAYGEKTIEDENSDSNPLAFTGHYQDRESGLVYMKGRYYSPELGRFLSPDPANFASQVEDNPMLFNRYAYANNNPYTFSDPDGRSPAKIIGAAAGAYTLYETYQTYQNEGGVAAAKTLAVGAVLSATGLGTIKAISKGLKWAKSKIKAGSGPKGNSPPVDVPKGPTIGGGGTLDKLSPNEIRRIQNAANRSGKDIGVVGSRVNPNKNLRPDSDYDFVIDANNKTRGNLSRSLPGGKNVREGLENNQDIYKGAVDTNRPHVIFHPE